MKIFFILLFSIMYYNPYIKNLIIIDKNTKKPASKINVPMKENKKNIQAYESPRYIPKYIEVN